VSLAMTESLIKPLAGSAFLGFALLCANFLTENTTRARENSSHYALGDKRSFRLPAEIPAPPENALTPDRIALGKMLFFDPRLSGSNAISCATCHNPALGWSDGKSTATGDRMQVLDRATPPIVNLAFNNFFMWDGRFHSLEEQAWGPMTGPTEMHGSQRLILGKLSTLPGYVAAFSKAYPGEGITPDTVAKSIASFERTIISKDSPFDRWIDGDESALSPSAKHGFELFTGKANCVVCHQGANFTDQGFHNIGLRGNTDPGRYAIVPIRILRGAFKTPTLRDVALSAPFMHNGEYPTLEEVVEHYDRGGEQKDNLDPNIKPLNLSEQDKRDLVEFLNSLTGTQPDFVLPRLPQ
jgi:cytochrome c peroxidase